MASLPQSTVDELNNMTAHIQGVGLGDIVQYLVSTLGDREHIVPILNQPTVKPAVNNYSPGKMSKDAEYVLKLMQDAVACLNEKIDKEHAVCSHQNILNALISLEERVRKLENT